MGENVLTLIKYMIKIVIIYALSAMADTLLFLHNT